jgi:hypothetical protein
VRVAGFGKAVRMDLEDVFVSADVMYQIMQRIYCLLVFGILGTVWTGKDHGRTPYYEL